MIYPFASYTNEGVADYDTDLRVWAQEFDTQGGIIPEWWKAERAKLDGEIAYRGLDLDAKPFT